MEKEKRELYLEKSLLESVENRCKKQGVDIEDFISESIERQYLFPFLSKRHLQNYCYLQDRFSNIQNSRKRQILFYLVAYDGFYMEYADYIYKVENNKEIVKIPKELNELLYPGYCLIDAAYELYTKETLENMENKFKRLVYDKNELKITLNALLMTKDIIVIDEAMYLHKLCKRNEIILENKNFTLDEYIESELFKSFGDKMKMLIKELFNQITKNNIEVSVKPGSKNELTFSLITKNNKRLAMVASSDDGTNLRVGINRWKNGVHGNTLYCYELTDMELVVKDEKIPDSDLITKYRELI